MEDRIKLACRVVAPTCDSGMLFADGSGRGRRFTQCATEKTVLKNMTILRRGDLGRAIQEEYH